MKSDLAISVIIPTYHEEKSIRETVEHTIDSAQNPSQIEIVIVDSSRDHLTRDAVPNHPNVHYHAATQSGRGNQMNQGASHARGQTLLFLHADTVLPSAWDQLITDRITHPGFGGFIKKFNIGHASISDRLLLRMVQLFSNTKVRLGYELLGDNAIFISRSLFETIGGYSEGLLMEDVALSRLLRGLGYWPVIIVQPLTTSARRFIDNGVWATIRTMMCVRHAYNHGTTGDDLVNLYKSTRH